jgi:plasmid maintenance system antidote protein VapI
MKDDLNKTKGTHGMNKLKIYLSQRGAPTQRDFAEMIGTTPTNLGRLVNGKSSPSLPMAYEIEKNTGGLVSVYHWIPDEQLDFRTRKRLEGDSKKRLK